MTFLCCALAVLAAYTAVFWLLNRVWGPVFEPQRTDPGREAYAALTASRPYPTGRRRALSPVAPFEADLRAARTHTKTTTGGTHG